ncbi:conserved hypothetical protein [Trichinella spiralis]|uniref:hypothetical protein n=1 Tax=Trichinella spiralis TaxID=6334 RepID=UPI0001EFEE77|nr:conserved hypothetical protein [Trichinella spiralis]
MMWKKGVFALVLFAALCELVAFVYMLYKAVKLKKEKRKKKIKQTKQNVNKFHDLLPPPGQTAPLSSINLTDDRQLDCTKASMLPVSLCAACIIFVQPNERYVSYLLINRNELYVNFPEATISCSRNSFQMIVGERCAANEQWRCQCDVGRKEQ